MSAPHHGVVARSCSSPAPSSGPYGAHMTMTAEATVNVAATPRQILEFVLDFEQYRKVDPKIVRAGAMTGPDAQGKGTVKLWARMRGLPPAPDVHDFDLRRWSSLTFTGARKQPGRLLFEFTGVVECEPVGDTTRVRHAYEFHFKGPLKVIERANVEWLQRELDTEMTAIVAHFNQGDGAPAP